MSIKQRDDWTTEDYEDEAFRLQVLKEHGMAAYCALRDAEIEKFLLECRGGFVN